MCLRGRWILPFAKGEASCHRHDVLQRPVLAVLVDNPDLIAVALEGLDHLEDVVVVDPVRVQDLLLVVVLDISGKWEVEAIL